MPLKKAAAVGAATTAVKLASQNTPQVNLNPDPFNFVVVRIWRALLGGEQVGPAKVASASNLTDQDSIGHATLMVVKNTGNNQFKFRYLSLWPEGRSRDLHRPSVLMDNPAEDQILENNNRPDETYVLFSLNHQRLWDATKKSVLEDRFPSWSLGGNKKLTNPRRSVGAKFSPESYRPSESCSGAVYALLVEAGIRQLSTQQHLTAEYAISHPDNLAEYVRDARDQERIRFNATVSFEQRVSALFRDALLQLNDKKTFKTQFGFVDHLFTSDGHRQQCIQHQQSLRTAVLRRSAAVTGPAIPGRPGHEPGPTWWPAFFKMVGVQPNHLTLVGAALAGIAVSNMSSWEFKDLCIVGLLVCVAALGVKQYSMQQAATFTR